MKHILFFSLFIFLKTVIAQPSIQLEQYLKGKNITTLKEAELSLNEWLKIPGNEQSKGWKQTARAIHFWSQRVEKFEDIPKYNSEMELFYSQQANFQTRSSVNWLPFGPDKRGINYTSMNDGVGRVHDIAFHPSAAGTYWAATEGGGIWKTTNSGNTWTPLTDYLPNMNFYSIDVSKQNPNNVYAITTDRELGYFQNFIGTSSSSGFPAKIAYKSTDGGVTWAKMNLTQTNAYYESKKIRVNNFNDKKIVALTSENICISTDAGNNWIKPILGPIVNQQSLYDFEMSPVDSNKIFCIKKMNSNELRLFKSIDFGITWDSSSVIVNTTAGVGAAKMAISKNNPNVMYCVVANSNYGLQDIYKSLDGGLTWIAKNATPNILDWDAGIYNQGQAYHDLTICIDNSNDSIIYVGGVNIWKSVNSGSNWDMCTYWASKTKQSIHADQMIMKFNPYEQKYYVCNDGGIYRTNSVVAGSWSAYNSSQSTYNFPTSWENITDGLNISTIYTMGISQNTPGGLAIGTQDNAIFIHKPATNTWHNIIGGDGFDCAIDDFNPDISMVTVAGLLINYYFTTNGGQTYTTVTVPSIYNNGDSKLTKFQFSPNKRAFYVSRDEILKTNNNGATWQPISNFNFNGCSSNLYISRVDSNDLAFNYDKDIYLTRDHGQTWKKCIDPSNAQGAFIPKDIFISSLNDSIVYVAGFYRKILKTYDYGNTWNNIVYNLPNLGINSIVEWENDPYHTIFAALDVGVFYINDTLTQWKYLSNGLPNVIVNDLKIDQNTNTLYAATYGRGVWKCDLNQLTGIEEKSIAEKIVIYPNPNNGSFQIKLPEPANYTVNIIDIHGKVIVKENINSTDTYTTNQKLVSGLYFIQINNQKGNIIGNYKVVVQ